MPPDEPQPPARPPLRRSTTDSVIGGVAGGIGRRLGVDPLAIRIAFVILVFAGGLGIFAYLACLLFIPSDDPSKQQRWGVARVVGAGLLVLAAFSSSRQTGSSDPGWCSCSRPASSPTC